jgi:hypothetical protein
MYDVANVHRAVLIEVAFSYQVLEIAFAIRYSYHIRCFLLLIIAFKRQN